MGAGAFPVAGVEGVALCWTAWTAGGMPFMRNSTATSGLPCDALRHALTSASGKPIPVKLEITSAGKSSESDVGAGVEVVAVVVDVSSCEDGAGAGAAVVGGA